MVRQFYCPSAGVFSGVVAVLIAANCPTPSPAGPLGGGQVTGERSAFAATRSEQSRIVNGFVVDSGPPRAADVRARYYVEFRARPLNVYGHTYIVYGRLDDSGAPAELRFVGLHPENDVGLTIGSLPVTVPATTLPVADDARLPVLAAYRVSINADQYEKVQAFVYEMRSRPLTWNLYTLNCNYFAGELAKRIGLQRPLQNFQFTPLYVKQLESLNGK